MRNIALPDDILPNGGDLRGWYYASKDANPEGWVDVFNPEIQTAKRLSYYPSMNFGGDLGSLETIAITTYIVEFWNNPPTRAYGERHYYAKPYGWVNWEALHSWSWPDRQIEP